MKKSIIVLILLGFAITPRAYGDEPNITFRQPPTTDDEKAIAQVFETWSAKRKSDPKSASDLYTPDAIVRYVTGQYSEEKVAEGREKIAELLSAGRNLNIEVRDIVIKVAGDQAEVAGNAIISGMVQVQRNLGGTPVGVISRNWVREEERSWQLRREADGWRIYRQEFRNSRLTVK